MLLLRTQTKSLPKHLHFSKKNTQNNDKSVVFYVHSKQKRKQKYKTLFFAALAKHICTNINNTNETHVTQII